MSRRSQRARAPSRRAVTLLELLIALSALAVAVTLLAEVGIWSVQERERTALRQDALETAVNLLEGARATPWEELSEAWAARQELPPALARRMEAGRLAVRVEPGPGSPLVKRVTVELRWDQPRGGAARPVRLVGDFAARSTGAAAAAPGGKP